MRGYFEIGIIGGKNPINVGTLWRSASQLGAAGIFTIGRRYPRQASDTTKTWRHVPMREYDDVNDWWKLLPFNSLVVAIEMGGKPLQTFCHPERAIYLLGAEDNGIPRSVLRKAHHVISLPSIRTPSFNVAVAGSIVMYDRFNKETMI